MTGGRRPRIEVLCLTYGEPPEVTVDAQYGYSLSILNRLTRRVAPIPKFITPLLAWRRARQRVATFTEMGYSSPLEEYTRKQVDGLRAALARLRPDVDFTVRTICEFRPPYIWEFLEKMLADPPDEIVLLPLYVAESDFTSGVSRTDLARFHASHPRNPLPKPRYLKGFGFDERMGKAFADFVWKQCVDAGWSEEQCRESVLILGAHGTLQFPPPGINSAYRETLYFFGLIRKHLKHRFRTIRIGWLNHKLGGQWTFPEVADSARESWESGIRKVVYFPFGFMADNAESQLEGKGQLAAQAWEKLLYLPCPNDDPAFIEFLAIKTIERLSEPAEDWETIEQGTAWLIQPERVAPPGTQGPLNFGSRTLAICAATLWLLVALMLGVRGVSYAQNVHPVLHLAIVGVLAVVLGAFKGWKIIAKMATKNLVRLRRLPQPSPLYKMYSGATWGMIAFFATLGMSLRFIPGIPPPVRATILLAVGLSLLIGAVQYFRNLGMAEPVTRAARPERPRLPRPDRVPAL